MMTMTYEEIRDYVRYENEVRQVGSYESDEFAVVTGHDEDGEVVEDTTTMIDVHLLGDDEHGYILTTCDDADGPTDDLGTDVYPTAAAALAAMQAQGVDLMPDGERLLAEPARATDSGAEPKTAA